MKIEGLRNKIDQLDTEITALVCQRLHLCGQIAAQKKKCNESILAAGRERQILTRIAKEAGDSYGSYLRMLYTVIFDLSRSYQTTLMGKGTALRGRIERARAETSGDFPLRATIACPGVEGAYSQAACDRLFSRPEILYFRTFAGVFQAVEQGLCDYGVLPIENSSSGSVNSVYDLMYRYKFHIVRSISLAIDHHLLANGGANKMGIREIISHEQALCQCSDFLHKNPAIKATVCENTALAAKLVAESGRKDIAAISSRDCAALYGLDILSDKIQNSENNYTRFICIGRDLEIYPGSDRISLMFTLPHTPGSLYLLLARFAALGLNLTKLESRPQGGRDFEFLFYIDLEASVWSEEVVGLVSECAAGQELFVFLGSYREVR